MAGIRQPESDQNQKTGARGQTADEAYGAPQRPSHNGSKPAPDSRPAQPGQAGQRPATSTIGRQLLRFWIKINRDWMFNLAGMLAYNLLLAALPLLILSISLLGLIFQHSAGACSPNRLEGQLINNLASILPSQISGIRQHPHGGAAPITVLCDKLSHESFALAAFGVITGLWFGSRLFVKMENSFGVIFRLRSRSFLRQNGTALGMTALFAVLGPLSVLVTLVPARLLEAAGAPSITSGALSRLIGSLCGIIIAFALLELIYVVVPNQRVRPKDVWGGALVSALLLSAYELLFPLYARFLSSSNSYGAVAGLIVIVLLFFYYFAVIVLLGAEINSWYHGHQESSGDVATVLAQANRRQRPPAS